MATPRDPDAAFLRSARPPYEALRPRVRIADLFCGCGGLTLGTAEAARRLGLGVEVRLAVDHDARATAVYEANLPGADVRCASVEELFDGQLGHPVTDCEGKLKERVGALDVLVGGPPCQGHSDLNNHTRRSDPRNALYSRMARAAEVLQPTILLIENVPAVRHDVEDVAHATIRALRSCGYSVADAVVDISRLGAPQSRRRHITLASRDSRLDVLSLVTHIMQSPPPTPVRSVRWAIEDLAGTRAENSFDSASVASEQNATRIAWLFDHRRYDLPNNLRPKCHQSDHSYSSMYGRLRWDRPAQTVTTGFGSMGQGRYVHPSKRRTITPHEAARLQMLPDFWDFSSAPSRGSLARLIGNAVPPVLARSLLEPAFRSLGLASRASHAHEASRANSERRSPSARVSSSGVSRRSGVPHPSSGEARRRMKSVRQSGTDPELALRTEIDHLGLRYQVDAPIPGTRRRADLLFEDSGILVLVDGCYWHGCPVHGTSPKSNAKWWREKLDANRRRDRDTDQLAHQNGWTVLRFWEHDDAVQSAQGLAALVALVSAEASEGLPTVGPPEALDR